MNLANFVYRQARINPHYHAVSYGDKALWDYQEFAHGISVLAGSLRHHLDLQTGDRVALFMKNSPAFLQVLYAAWAAGLVVVPINNKLHPKEAAYIIENSQSRCVFASAALAAQLDVGTTPVIDTDGRHYQQLLYGYGKHNNITEPINNDLAWLFYTSGTTGHPKGVMLSHQNLLTMSLCYLADVDNVSHRDTILYAAPMSHGAGLYSMVHAMMGASHLIPESGGFDCQELFSLSKRYHNISMFAAPTMVRRMVTYCQKSNADPSGIKTIVYGGGPMYVEDILKGIEVMGDRFVQIYGQGESPMTITSLKREQLMDKQHPRYLQRLASVGTAQSAVDVRIVDGDGRPLPIGEVGEIIVRGATVMSGYWQNEEANAKVLRHGWLYTGDMGSLDEDGFLTLKDRSKDVIITGGTNVYPREIEEVLLTHASIAEVSVVGRPNPEWGEEIVAFVVSENGEPLDFSQLDQHCLDNIARFKRPKHYIQLAKLPKNNYGKVLKTVLREQL